MPRVSGLDAISWIDIDLECESLLSNFAKEKLKYQTGFKYSGTNIPYTFIQEDASY
jgi:hypothetical protein